MPGMGTEMRSQGSCPRSSPVDVTAATSRCASVQALTVTTLQGSQQTSTQALWIRVSTSIRRQASIGVLSAWRDCSSLSDSSIDIAPSAHPYEPSYSELASTRASHQRCRPVMVFTPRRRCSSRARANFDPDRIRSRCRRGATPWRVDERCCGGQISENPLADGREVEAHAGPRDLAFLSVEPHLSLD